MGDLVDVNAEKLPVDERLINGGVSFVKGLIFFLLKHTTTNKSDIKDETVTPAAIAAFGGTFV